jgi:uncharacterized protein (DUF58 family)
MAAAPTRATSADFRPVLIPHRPLLIALGLWLALALAAAFLPAALIAWQAAGLALLALATGDALALRWSGNPVTVVRERHAALPVGGWHTVRLRLESPLRPAAGWLFDRHPPALPAEGLPLAFRVAAGEGAQLSYRLHLLQRGRHQFGPVELRLASPLGLWLRRHFAGEPEPVRVYPDFARVTQYALLATGNRLGQIGLLQRRRRGQGLEFHQLRDYRQDDSPRQIDWKATARQRRLISRDYQDERDQQIVFLLDCGARMRAQDGELSHFDHTLNAVLLLAYVALRQGDGVGVATFAQSAPRFLPPRKSLAALGGVLDTLYDIQPSLRPPDYVEAGERLARRLARRSLVVVLTSVFEEDGEMLRGALKFLRQRHVVTLASLRESVFEDLRRRPVRAFEEALTYAAAIEYRRSRERQLGALRQGGVGVLDVAPPQLPMALVNHYWQLKRAGVL